MCENSISPVCRLSLRQNRRDDDLGRDYAAEGDEPKVLDCWIALR